MQNTDSTVVTHASEQKYEVENKIEDPFLLAMEKAQVPQNMRPTVMKYKTNLIRLVEEKISLQDIVQFMKNDHWIGMTDNFIATCFATELLNNYSTTKSSALGM